MRQKANQWHFFEDTCIWEAYNNLADLTVLCWLMPRGCWRKNHIFLYEDRENKNTKSD